MNGIALMLALNYVVALYLILVGIIEVFDIKI
jgi:Protein of unknown function (DUF3096)